MTQEMFAHTEGVQANRPAFAVPTAVATGKRRNRATSSDTMAQALQLFDLSTRSTSKGLDPIASLPKPVAPKIDHQHPYTIWQAMAAISELFKPQAITSDQVMHVLNDVSTQIEGTLQKIQKYQDEVSAIKQAIKKHASSDQWLHWGMAVAGVIMGCVMGFVIGGPVGAVAGAAVGIANILLSSEITIGNKPLLNYVIDKASDGKAHLGKTSVYGYIGEGVYHVAADIHRPNSKKGRERMEEICESVTQVLLGVAVGAAVGFGVTGAVEAAVAAEGAAEGVTDGVTEDVAENGVAAQEESVSGDEAGGVGISDEIVEEGPDEIEVESEEVEEAGDLARQQQRHEVQERRNAGGVGSKSGRPRVRGFVMGLTEGNAVASANNGHGNAYEELVQGLGASESVASKVGFGVEMGVNLATGIAGFSLGAAPGSMNSFMESGMKVIPFMQSAVGTATSGAQGWAGYTLHRLYSRLAPVQKKLDQSQGTVQTTQLYESSVLGLMTSTTQMITQTMDTAVAMLNQTRQTVQSIFQA